MFHAINQLAQRMSAPMAERMKPMTTPPPPPEAIIEKKVLAQTPEIENERKYHANAYVGFGIPLSQISDHIGINVGLRTSNLAQFSLQVA
jgi:hypothetical protein